MRMTWYGVLINHTIWGIAAVIHKITGHRWVDIPPERISEYAPPGRWQRCRFCDEQRRMPQ